MLKRKIEKDILNWIHNSNKALLLYGVRQAGKTFIIRHVGQRLFENYIELNFVEVFNGPRLFEQFRTVKDFYFPAASLSLVFS